MTKIKKERTLRTLHLDTGNYKYKVFHASVLIVSPEGKKSVIPCKEIAGVDDWSREKRKGNAAITPSILRNWLNGQSKSN